MGADVSEKERGGEGERGRGGETERRREGEREMEGGTKNSFRFF
jgi:hypothetical protein